jgi:hypothetical protein
MALVSCPECGQSVSDTAPVCVHCGYTLHPGRRRGWGFEWRTRAQLFGWPLVHVAFGRDPQTLRLRVAKGVIAIGQFGIGLITVAQFGVGLLFGLGQFMLGGVEVAQFAGGIVFGLGQVATGYIAVGQLAVGEYVRAQMAIGRYVWTAARQDPEATALFGKLWEAVRGVLRK